MEHRDTFEAVAGLYGEVRPGYPPALYDDLARLGGLDRQATLLEVGCGAGQATRDLAARARWVTAVDPGERLIAEARRRISARNVNFVVTPFENYEPSPGMFDLVVSAQAWHWVDPAYGFPKAARALKPGGAFAIFGHVPLTPDGAMGEAFKEVYEAHMPGAWGQPPPQAVYEPNTPFANLHEAGGLFGPVSHRSYRWTWSLDPATLGRYLRTDSTYHVLPEGPRFALFDALAHAVADQGGLFKSPWQTHLHVAARL